MKPQFFKALYEDKGNFNCATYCDQIGGGLGCCCFVLFFVQYHIFQKGNASKALIYRSRLIEEDIHKQNLTLSD